MAGPTFASCTGRLHIACANLAYRDIWFIQAVIIPLFYLVYCAVHILMSRLLLSIVRNGIFGANSLLKCGWRPRRSFTFESLKDKHVPGVVRYRPSNSKQ